MKNTLFIWNTSSLQVYMDDDGDIVLHEHPTLTNDFIYVNPSELLAFCKHYVSLVESEE